MINKLKMIGRNNKLQFQLKMECNQEFKINFNKNIMIIKILSVYNNKFIKNFNNYKDLKVQLKM